MNIESHARDAAGHSIERRTGEVGEIACPISRADGTIVSPLEGSTNEAESQEDILADLFERGDRWWRSGDLFRRDQDDCFCFVDRIGDTCRCRPSEGMAAVPLLVRRSKEAELTANFKLRKVELRNPRFDPRRVAGLSHASSHRQRKYVRLDEAALRQLDIPLPAGN